MCNVASLIILNALSWSFHIRSCRVIQRKKKHVYIIIMYLHMIFLHFLTRESAAGAGHTGFSVTEEVKCDLKKMSIHRILRSNVEIVFSNYTTGRNSEIQSFVFKMNTQCDAVCFSIFCTNFISWFIAQLRIRCSINNNSRNLPYNLARIKINKIQYSYSRFVKFLQ